MEIKQLVNKIKILFLRVEVVENLREQIKILEEENTALRELTLGSTEMVLQYKSAMQQMREHLNTIVQLQEEEEDIIDPLELIRKKTTIH